MAMHDVAKRFPVPRRGTRIPARFRVTGQGADYFFSDFARDVSLHGMCVTSIRPLSVDQHVHLHFRLREEETEESPITVVGRVRWVGPEAKIRGSSHRHGVEFVEMSDEARSRLESYLGHDSPDSASN